MNRIHLSISAALLVFAPDAIAQNAPQVVTNQIADFTEYAGAPAHSIDLTSAFADQDVSAAVRLTTVLGAIDVALFGQQKPITVANFLNYLDQGRYFKIDPATGQLASTFVHRSECFNRRLLPRRHGIETGSGSGDRRSDPGAS
jgi:Cyclophilin type peptidyl-prolyl cis-trans isomerase/CLD